MSTRPLRVLYVGLIPPDKSTRDAPYLDGMRARGVEILECWDSTRGLGKYFRFIKKYWPQRHSFDVVFVGHTSALVVPLMRLLTRKPTVFNALAPLYDGMVSERGTYSSYSPRAFVIWCADYLSFLCSNVVLLETNQQVECVHKAYYVSRRKLFRIFSTVDPKIYAPDPRIVKDKTFLCVFRAWVTPATGAEYIVEAARILQNEDVRFRFIVRGQSVPKLQKMIENFGLTNIEVITGAFIEQEKLNKLILEGCVYLGQFSNHPRLERTIQFKTIEACAFGMPYITADLPSNRELLTDGVNCLFTRRADPRDIADKILTLKNDPALRERLGTAAHELYKKELAPDVLALQIIGIINTLLV